MKYLLWLFIPILLLGQVKTVTQTGVKRSLIRGDATTLTWTVTGDYSADSLLFIAVDNDSNAVLRLTTSGGLTASYSGQRTTITGTIYAATTENFISGGYLYDISSVTDSITLIMGLLTVIADVSNLEDTVLAPIPYYTVALDTSDQEPGVLISRNSTNTTDWWSLPMLADSLGVISGTPADLSDLTTRFTNDSTVKSDALDNRSFRTDYNTSRYKNTDYTTYKRLNIIGNSISEGVGTYDWNDSSYVGLLKKRYKEFYHVTNEGYVNTDSNSVTTNKPFTVTLSGFSGYAQDGAYLGGSYSTSSTSGHYIQYDYVGDNFYIVYKTVSGGGNLAIYLNDTLKTTIATGTGTASNFSISSKITATYYGSQTLKILKTDSSPTTVSGVYFCNDLTDLMINNLSRSSLQLINVSDAVLYQEAQANGVIISLGVNDRSNAANVDSVKAKLRRFLGYVEANGGTAIVCDFIFGADQSDTYKTALRTVAAEFPQFTFIDFANYFYKGSSFNYGTLVPNDGTHPTSYGHKIIADKLSELLGIAKPDTIINENFAFLGAEYMNLTTGYDNMASGFGSMLHTTTGYGNTSFGIGTLKDNTAGFANTGFGKNTLIWNTTGYSNTAFGYNAGSLNLTGYGNTAIGNLALYGNRTGIGNIAIGSNAMLSSLNSDYNTAIGYQTLSVDTSGDYNVAIGGLALSKLLSGSYNVGIGYYAGFNITTAGANTILGGLAGQNITTSSSNVGIGTGALKQLSTGNGENVSIGTYSLNGLTTGYWNTAIGARAGFTNATGYQNTYLGYYAGYLHTGLASVFIGYRAGYNETGNNKLYIDNTDTSTPLVWGDFGTDSLKINGDLTISGNLYAKPYYREEFYPILNIAVGDTIPLNYYDHSTVIDSIRYDVDDSVTVQIEYGTNGSGTNLLSGTTILTGRGIITSFNDNTISALNEMQMYITNLGDSTVKMWIKIYRREQ